MTHTPMLSEVTELALIEHLLADASPLNDHIRRGGTFGSYVTGWRETRDLAALATEVTDDIARTVLTLPVPRWDEGQGATVRDYLVALLDNLVTGDADQKYGMTGNSDWQYDLYEPMAAAGLLPEWRDGYGIGYRPDGSNHPEDRRRANKLLTAAILLLDVPGRPA